MNEKALPGIDRFQIAVVALMIIAGAVAYPYLPNRIPEHWNVAGQIDRWATKSFLSVFFPVLVVLGLMLLAWAMPRIDPLKKSYLRFRASYHFIIDMIIAFMGFIYALTLYAAFDPRVQTGVLVPVGVGLLFAAIGNQLPRVKRNFFMGIRTPWTLASEIVWVRTHRVGARVFVAAGLGCVLTAFLPPPLNFVLFMALLLGATAGMVVYSYVIYRRLERSGELGPPMEPPPTAATG